MAEEGDTFGENSGITVSAIMTFAGIFAAIVAAFLIESYKTLKPDTGAQAVFLLEQLVAGRELNTTGPFANRLPAFHASETDVLINTLWFAGLVLSLMAALLATLYQEWIRQLLKAQHRVSDETAEEHSLRHLSLYVGARGFGLDLVAPSIIGLMHLAVALFLYGLHLFLSEVHPVPAWWTSRIIAICAVIYVVGSLFPLFDATCFYRTPLTSFATRLTLFCANIVFCLMSYLAMLTVVVTLLLTRRRLHPVWSYFLGGKFWWGLLRDSLFIPRAIGASFAYCKQRYWDGIDIPVTFWTFIMTAAETGDVPQYYPPIGGRELGALSDHVGSAILDHPAFLFRISLDLLNPQSRDFGEFFVRTRREPELVEKLAAGLTTVVTVDEAAGAVRAVQYVLFAGTNDDDIRQAASDQERRWDFMEPLLDALPEFVGLLNHHNMKAMAEEDLIIMASVCSLRWSLLLLWKRIPAHARPHSIAQQHLQRLFLAFEGSYSSLRLLPLSADHERSLDRLFASDVDPLRELALRNAMSLLSAAVRCQWEGSWRTADSPYLNPGTRSWGIPYLSATNHSLLEWNKEFPEVRSGRRKSPASAAFHELLQQTRLDAWTEPGATLATPAGTDCPPDAILALRDLASTVDLHAPRPCVAVDSGRHEPPTQDPETASVFSATPGHPEVYGPQATERSSAVVSSHHTHDTVNGSVNGTVNGTVNGIVNGSTSDQGEVVKSSSTSSPAYHVLSRRTYSRIPA
ncbi:unnamed protein product [Peniophora sp. CBMAI 1063]|nr:unnamed protein product [Peniophora sp. CBMAI 1063]